jgi:hypothetical protein
MKKPRYKKGSQPSSLLKISRNYLSKIVPLMNRGNPAEELFKALAERNLRLGEQDGKPILVKVCKEVEDG